MGIKEDCKELLQKTFGAATASKADNFSDDVNNCLEETRTILAKLLGEELADMKVAPLKEKYS